MVIRHFEGKDGTSEPLPSTSQRMKPNKAEGGPMKKKPSMVVQIDNLKRKHSESV